MPAAGAVSSQRVEKLHDASLNIARLFPSCVVSQCVNVDAEMEGLLPEEAGVVSDALPKRLREFTAGRACARDALVLLGCSPVPLLKKTDGSVAWPHGITGSVSHSDRWCGVAVAYNNKIRSVGLDIEKISRISKRIHRKILTSQELRWLQEKDEKDRQKFTGLIFSAKEALYKCLNGFVSVSIGFTDAVIIPSADTMDFDILPGDKILRNFSGLLKLYGRYMIYDGEIFTSVVMY